jgi:hypothetical protein
MSTTNPNGSIPAALAERCKAPSATAINGEATPSETGLNGGQTPSATGVNGGLRPSATAVNGEAGPSATGVNGRDSGGRFAKGNRIASGNPFNRRVAGLRSALLQAVTEEDVHQLAVQLVEAAKKGDLAAIKLLFLYTIGRPSETVNPDKLDLEEWDIRQQSNTPKLQDVWDIVDGMPVEAVLESVGETMPAVVEKTAGMISAAIGEPGPKGKKARWRERKRRKALAAAFGQAPKQPNQERNGSGAAMISVAGTSGSLQAGHGGLTPRRSPETRRGSRRRS